MICRAGAILFPPGHPDIEEIREDLSMPNPALRSWLTRMERVGASRAGPRPPETVNPLVTMDSGPWAGGVCVPREAPLRWDSAPVDRTVYPPAPPVRLTITLRDYQEEMVTATAGGGIAKASCGSGKTTAGLRSMALHNTPALVIVDTLDLVDQWRDRINGTEEHPPQLTMADGSPVLVGIAADGKRSRLDDGRVVIVTWQTLSRWTWWDIHTWARRFGLVILDECDIAASPQVMRVLSGCPGRVRIGFSATPKRDDGLTPFIEWVMGPVRIEVDAKRLQDDGHVLIPTVEWIETKWGPHEKIIPATVKGDEDAVVVAEKHIRDLEMTTDEGRNEVILREARNSLDAGETVLVLSGRKAHCDWLAEHLGGVSLTSKLGRKARKNALDALRSGALKLATATQLADKGLDLVPLSTVILTAPSGSLGRIEQRGGRAARPMEGKVATIKDLVDDWGPYGGYAWKRFHLYRRLGWRVTPPPVGR